MNCQQARPLILELEDLQQASPDLEAHLADCAKCRAFHQRLELLESLVPQVPVPAPELKDQFCKAFAREKQATILPFLPEPPLSKSRPKERAQRKLAFAFAMASALLVCVLGWGIWHNTHSKPKATVPSLSQELAQRLSANPAWQAAHTMPERVTILKNEGDRLFEEACALARRRDLKGLARKTELYRELVEKTLLPSVEQIPVQDRPTLFASLAEGFSHTESSAERLASEITPAAASLREIALIARSAESHIRDLIRNA